MLNVLMLSLTLAAVEPQDTSERPTVYASANRPVRMSPDRVSFYALVESGAETSAEATQRAERKMKAVVDTARRLMPDARITTIPYTTATGQDGRSYPPTFALPFSARFAIKVEMQRVDRIGALASALLAAGASAFSSPVYDAAASDSVRRVKFQEAIAEARKDAEAMAVGLGMRLGELMTVTGSHHSTTAGNPSYISFNRNIEIAGAAPEVSFNTNVSVRYRLVPR